MSLRGAALWMALALASTACHRDAREVVRRDGNPDVFSVEDGDARMNAAIDQAKKTLDVFIQRLDAPSPTQQSASIKAPFATAEGLEHIWLVDVTYAEGRFGAEVGNEPVGVPNLKLGDRVEVSREQVSDWLVVDGDCVVGGYTIRAIRDSLEGEERIAFEQSAPPFCE